jgi:hypothetical protein
MVVLNFFNWLHPKTYVDLFAIFFQPFNFSKVLKILMLSIILVVIILLVMPILAFLYLDVMMRLIENLFVNELCWNIFFITLINNKWNILTKEFVEQATTQNFGWRMHLTNGNCFLGLTKKIQNYCLQKWTHYKDLVEMFSIHINMNHMVDNQCLIFHVFWSKFILILQVFDLFTFQCSFIYYENIWYDLKWI